MSFELFIGGTVAVARSGSCGITVAVQVGSSVSFGGSDSCRYMVIRGVRFCFWVELVASCGVCRGGGLGSRGPAGFRLRQSSLVFVLFLLREFGFWEGVVGGSAQGLGCVIIFCII